MVSTAVRRSPDYVDMEFCAISDSHVPGYSFLQLYMYYIVPGTGGTVHHEHDLHNSTEFQCRIAY